LAKCTPERVERSAQALAPLDGAMRREHDALIAEAGGTASSLVLQRGWLSCMRTEESLRKAIEEAPPPRSVWRRLRRAHRAQLRELEPHVAEVVIGGIHFRGSPTSSDPGMLTKAYADLFTRRAAASSTAMRGASRRTLPAGALPTANGPIEAREAVVALGPGPTTSFAPWATRSRSPSSAATTCITASRATPPSAIPCMTAMAASRWCR